MNYFRKAVSWLFFVPCIPAFLSCGNLSEKMAEKANDPVLATVYNKDLHLSDLRDIIPAGLNPKDSAETAQDFIQSWIRKETLLHEAESTLPEGKRDFEERLEQYRRDLLVYEYQKDIINQKLDTIVTPEEMRAYYEKNLSNFELKEDIVRLIFFKFPIDLRAGKRLWSLFLRGQERDMEELSVVAFSEGGNAFTDQNSWLSFSDILKEIPIVAYNTEHFLNNNKQFQIKDNNYIYFVNIVDFRIKNSISPFEFETQRIQNIILNKRKVELLRKVEEELVNEAYNKNEIKTF